MVIMHKLPVLAGVTVNGEEPDMYVCAHCGTPMKKEDLDLVENMHMEDTQIAVCQDEECQHMAQWGYKRVLK